MSTDYLQALLSDAEGYMIAARRGDLRAAREALDTVNYYQTLRETGEGEEPWLAADAQAGDIESEAIDIIERLTGQEGPKAEPHKCSSLICRLLGFHIKAPWEK